MDLNNLEYYNQQKKLVKKLEKIFQSQSKDKLSIVPMEKDYQASKEKFLAILAFLPVNITQEINDNLITPLKNIDPSHYYYPLDSLHITIKTVRTIHYPPLFEEGDEQKVSKMLTQSIPNFNSFTFTLEDVILFPTSVSLMGYCNNELQKFVLSLDQSLKDIGLPDNKKYLSNTIFWANINFCRFTRLPSEEFKYKVRSFRNIKIGKVKIDEVHLIKANAVNYRYSRTIISSHKLKEEKGVF
ncbi:hypothetical protein KKB40_02965 [Patescibacteria group bacterium]|nr:hypothetical protein [Patescibacteria group bacterium]